MQRAQKPGTFYLGKLYDPLTQKVTEEPFLYSSKNLTTHAVCVGMTGSGKTGLAITLLEEAGLNSIPSIIIDPKGDMGNLLLAFPNLSKEEFKPWIDSGEAERKGKTLDAYAEEVAKTWKEGLEASQESSQRVRDFKNAVSIEIYTPASKAGVPLSILSSLEAPSKEFAEDTDAMREKVLSTTSSLLGLLGIKTDPIKSREHILLSTIIEQSWKEGKNVDLPFLIQQIQKPTFDEVGVLPLDTFFPTKERVAFSVSLNNLLAAPGFQNWMEGAPLEIDQLLYTAEKKPKISILSIAHLNDSERMFFVTLFLNQMVGWMRKQTGTASLRAIFYMDEIFGYFPSTAAPPSKTPMLTLLKQARAYGLGLFLSTQNPVDLDYKGLSNCGTWFIGRLQTARDKARVMEGLSAASNGDIDSKTLDKLMSELGSRVFIMRSIYEKESLLFQTRWSLSYLRGPLTLAQIEILTKEYQKDFKNENLKVQKKEENQGSVKPPFLAGISQYFVNSPSESSIYYRPFIAGFSKLHFVDKKYNIDEWVNSCLVVELKAHTPLKWETAESHPHLKEQLSLTAAPNATYSEPQGSFMDEKKYGDYKKSLFDYLYQNNRFKLFEYKELKLVSGFEESEADFRERVLSALKEQKEAVVAKLKGDYEKKLTALKDKIKKAEEKKNTKEQNSFYQKVQAGLSITTTLIGAFFGRKLTKGTINQAGTSFKKIGRVGKESQEATTAGETVELLNQQLQEVEKELEEAINKIALPSDPKALKLEEVIVTPRKTDIVIEEIALIWWS